MDAQDILIRAHEIIGEFGITRGQYAVDGDGNTVSYHNPRAQRFCSVGAIGRAARDLGVDTSKDSGETVLTEAIIAFGKSAGVEAASSVTNWNDNASDADIKAAFAKAAGKEQPEPSTEPIEIEEPVAALV